MIQADRTTASITQACALLDVSRRTIYNWIASGRVRPHGRGGSVRIFVDTLWRTPDDTAVSRWDREAAAPKRTRTASATDAAHRR